MAEYVLSERLAIIGTIDPDANSTAAVDSDAWDMQKYRRVMVIMLAGQYATAASAVGKLYAGATSTGAWTTLVGKTASLTEVGGGSDGQAIINLSAAEVSSTGKRWAKLTVTYSGATTVDGGAVILGDLGRFTEAYTTIAYNDL